MAAAVGLRYFSREIVEEVFREEMKMIASTGFIQEWILGAEEKGRTEGKTEGATEEARKLASLLVEERFGAVPEGLANRIQAADAAWCERLVRQVMRVNTTEELDLSDPV